MRSLLFSVLLGLSLIACSKQSKTTAPAADPAPAPAAPATAEAPPQGIAVGEPNPAAAPGPRPASITDADVALADKLVGAIEKMASNLIEAGTDCAKFAAAVKSSSSEMSAVMEEGKKFDERLKSDDAAKKWFEATYAPKVMGTMGKLMTNPCINDKAVQEAMASAKMM
jgi:hypothetical protein